MILRATSGSWNKTALYWEEVRGKWAEIYQKQERFSLKSRVDEKTLYESHFGYAAEVQEKGYDAEARA